MEARHLLKKMKQQEVLEDLKEKVAACLQGAQQFKTLTKETLHYSSGNGSWNILQCLEHCNRYWDFYEKEFNAHLNPGQRFDQSTFFSPGFWGNMFTKMMLPKEGKLKKMKTFKSKNPSPIEATMESIDVFIRQQEELLIIIDKAKKINLNKHKCNLTVPLVKMNYGSTLQFIVFHNLRHLKQAKRNLT